MRHYENLVNIKNDGREKRSIDSYPLAKRYHEIQFQIKGLVEHDSLNLLPSTLKMICETYQNSWGVDSIDVSHFPEMQEVA